MQKDTFYQTFAQKFDRNSIQELKCSLLTGIVKILIIQPFDFIRYRIQSSDYPVSVRKITKSLIDKEGFKAFLMGSPATTFGVFCSSLLHFTMYQSFQKYFILKEFDEEISNSLKNLEIFKLMELNHSNNRNWYNNSTLYNQSGIDNNEFYINEQDFIVRMDFINNYKLAGKLDKLKFDKKSNTNFHNEENIIFTETNKNSKEGFTIKDSNKTKNINDTSNEYQINRENNSEMIDVFDYSAKCYEEHLSKILKICAFSGLLSGSALGILTAPIDNVRIKMQAIQNIEILEKHKYVYSNTLNCILYTYRENGIKGFFKATNFCLLREGISSTVYFTSFEYLKNKEKIKNKSTKIKFYKSFIFGAIAGGVNWLITFPIDTVKTKLISDSVLKKRNVYKNAYDCIKINYSKVGIRSFYNGFSLVFFRGLIVNGTVLSSYDFCRARLVSNN